jgi:apolipoprotein N-acyltransferase
VTSGALDRARGELFPALASALLFGVAFPPHLPLAAALCCLTPLTVAVARQADSGYSWRAAARTGFWFGSIGYALNLSWIVGAVSMYSDAGILAYLTVVGLLGAFVGVTMAVLWRVRRVSGLPLAILLPVVWVTLELVLERLPDLAFPWLPLALSSTGALPVAQLAEWSGAHGVSALIAALNGLAADAWLQRGSLRRALAPAAIAVGLLASAFTFGSWNLSRVPLRDVARIAVVQPAIPQREKWSPASADAIVHRLATLTRQAGAAGPALIVWPEAALPHTFTDRPAWRDTVASLAIQARAPLLFGALESAPAHASGRFYNAALLAEPGALLGAQRPYYKTHLVPVIERTPFVEARAVLGVPFFGGYARGDGAPIPFSLPFGRVGALICFESTFAQRARQQRRAGADVIVAMTNDAWFDRTDAVDQHLAHLVLRAIETRSAIVRAANTGISAYIDPIGRVHGETPRGAALAAVYQLRTSDMRTLFTRAGDWVGLLSLLATAALLLGRAHRAIAS